MGSLGWDCAWELRADIEREGKGLLDIHRIKLREAERLFVQSTLDSINSAPESIFEEGANPDDSGMNHTYWDIFRAIVRGVLNQYIGIRSRTVSAF